MSVVRGSPVCRQGGWSVTRRMECHLRVIFGVDNATHLSRVHPHGGRSRPLCWSFCDRGCRLCWVGSASGRCPRRTDCGLWSLAFVDGNPCNHGGSRGGDCWNTPCCQRALSHWLSLCPRRRGNCTGSPSRGESEPTVAVDSPSQVADCD